MTFCLYIHTRIYACSIDEEEYVERRIEQKVSVEAESLREKAEAARKCGQRAR